MERKIMDQAEWRSKMGSPFYFYTYLKSEAEISDMHWLDGSAKPYSISKYK